MGQQTNPSQRQHFYALHQEGHTYAEISERFKISKACVRYWCRRQRDGKGSQTIYSSKPCRLLNHFHPRVRYVILRLRLEHPRWGPNRIRCKLKKRPSLLGLKLPSEAEIGRYLHQWRRFRRKPKKKPVQERKNQPTQVHQCWQIDFKMGIRLDNGTLVNLFTVRDPVGEAYIGDFIFETRSRQRIRMEEVRAVLRRCFDHWGTLPDEVQTDGESVLVSSHQNDFPSPFTLWLIGLGVAHRVIKNVTSNAEVERCHRTVNDYALVGNEGLTFPVLQYVLDQAIYELNYELPSRAEGCTGKPPIQAHPELLQPRHSFQAALELSLFDLKRVDQYLASFAWVHRVNRNGQVSIGAKHTRYMVALAYAGHEVEVRFDPKDRHFVFSHLGDPDHILRRQPARGLDLEDLTGLETWPKGLGPQQLLLPLSFEHEVNC
jgi:putative transposase